VVSFNFKALLLGTAAATFVVGCGESGDLNSDVVAAECRQLFRCGGSADDTVGERLYYGTEANCVAEESEGFDIADEYRQYIEAGTVVVDHGAVDRCVAAVRATCTNTAAADQACRDIFVGQVADGGGCTVDVECASKRCSAVRFDECGTCEALIPQGGECDWFDEDACAPGPNGERPTCNGGTCGVGEELPTADAELGRDCSYEQRCEPGLYCQEGTCARWRELGESCSPYDDSCGRGTYCLEDEDDEDQGICVPVRMESGPGEDCGILADEVVVCDRQAGLYCNDGGEGVCAFFDRDREEGDYCSESLDCVEGLTCLGFRCLAEPLIDGSECTNDRQCQSGNCVQQLESPFGQLCEPALTCP